MNKENKLKPKNILKTVILINLSIFILLGISLIIRFYYGSDIIFLSGALFAFIAVICNLFLLFRTRNKHFFIPVFMFVFYFIANILKVFYSESAAEYFLFILFLFAIWFFYILVKKKIKSRYREVLEMAANPIDESLDGFTARPYSAGKSDYSLEELQSGYIPSLIPLKRRGCPDDTANLVHFLASKEAAYITGETIRVDGGLILYGPNENKNGGMF